MASSKQYQNYVEEMITCSVCLDLVKEPRTLQQCFHSYCKPCIEQLERKQANPKGGISCPVCRSFSKSDEIRNNFFINDLLEMHKTAQELETGKKKLCQQCDDEDGGTVDEANFKCLDCRIELCKKCHRSHLKVPLLKGHRILPLNQETELVVDRLVFCELHDDEPIKLFCTECVQPICFKCKVIHHENHKTETVESALERIVPQIEADANVVEGNLQEVDKAITKIDEKIAEVDLSYSKCSKEVEKKAKEKIATITASEKKLKGDLNAVKVKEIQKLEKVKEELKNNKKEGENITRVIKTSIQRARHATLLTELVKGELSSKLNQQKEKKPKLDLQYQIPKLIAKDEISTKHSQIIQSENLIGNLTYKNISIPIANQPICLKENPRMWKGSFKQHVAQPMKEVFKINTHSICTRISIINGKVFLPERGNNKVSVYDPNGQIAEYFPIDHPCSIVMWDNDEYLVASKTGIFVLNWSSKTSRNICKGTFADLYVHNGQVFCLEYIKNQIIIFSKKDKWIKQEPVCLAYSSANINLRSEYNTLLVYSSTSDVSRWVCYVSDALAKVTKFDCFGNEIGRYKNFSYPYLFGFDEQSNLLVADVNENCVKTVDLLSGTITGTMLQGEAILDILYENGYIWMMKSSGFGNRHLIKYTIND